MSGSKIANLKSKIAEPAADLMTLDDIALRMKLGKRTVMRRVTAWEARWGLERLMVGPKSPRFTVSSYNRMIRRAAERCEPLL